jgi:hypothetical protein
MVFDTMRGSYELTSFKAARDPPSHPTPEDRATPEDVFERWILIGHPHTLPS